MNGVYKEDLDSMIIGRLYDVDIVFLHYHTFLEAVDKWNRRRHRLNMNNLIVKFNDQNGFTLSDYEDFKRLDYKNKIFVTADPHLANDEMVVYIEKYKDHGYVVDDTKLEELPIDIKGLLNSIR
jgi:uncharacterized protein (DUF1919 family)